MSKAYVPFSIAISEKGSLQRKGHYSRDFEDMFEGLQKKKDVGVSITKENPT